jgi:hypothetical protein
MTTSRFTRAAGVLALLCGFAAAARDDDESRPNHFAIRTLSTRPELVSGGDVLVEISVPRKAGRAIVSLNGRDISAAFRPGQRADTLLGLVTGLSLGANRLRVESERRGVPDQSITIMNHPLAGPVFGGPHQTPFVCQTQNFTLTVTGGMLGPALDADCSVVTRLDYVYMSTGGTLKPLPNPTVRPADLARTTTIDGRLANYILRVETGTINRAIYRIAVLHDPVTDPQPDPWHRPPSWNGRLVYQFGSGCSPGYRQGNLSNGEPLNNSNIGNSALAAGFATVGSSLNVFGTNCDDVVSAETAVMVKEHFVEEFGPPAYTLGVGASGGSMQQHLIAANYPGVLDAIVPGRSFPDVITFDAPYVDCDLIAHYFAAARRSPGRTRRSSRSSGTSSASRGARARRS